MGINKLEGTPWHIEKFHRKEDDDRRHKSRCKYYTKEECTKLGHRCYGSAHCLYYVESKAKVTVNPGNIDKESKEKVAKKLSEIFELDYEKTLKKVSKRSSIETIAKKIDKDKADELRKWMEEGNITTGINIDEDTKRYYPNNNLASQIIGFCGSDNLGLDGIQAKYDKVSSGTKGAIKRHTDAKGGRSLRRPAGHQPGQLFLR